MSKSLHSVFRRSPGTPRPSVEWPTVVLSVAVYGSWLFLTYFHAHLPGWLLFALGGFVIAWHSSFQHEVVHGHPTRWRHVNSIFGFPPLSLWLPFELYQQSHRLHHKDIRLTDPLDDPESKYLSLETWQGYSPLARFIETLHTPLIGRVIFGPFLMIGRFLKTELSSLRKGDWSHLRVWFIHGLFVSIVLVWLTFCGINLLQYFLFFIYPGTAILVLRSFAEHRAAPDIPHRTAIVENASIFGLLFLNNNLHAVHHRYPGASWYVLPEVYKLNRASFLSANASLVYNGYGEIISRFLFKAHDEIVHPFSETASAQSIIVDSSSVH